MKPPANIGFTAIGIERSVSVEVRFSQNLPKNFSLIVANAIKSVAADAAFKLRKTLQRVTERKGEG